LVNKASQQPLQLRAKPKRIMEYSKKNFPIELAWALKPLLMQIIFLLIAVIFILAAFLFKQVAVIFLIVASMFILLIITTAPIYIITPLLQRKNFHFFLHDNQLIFKQGILSKQERTLTYTSIQNIILKRDLFDVLLGLSSIEIENAGYGAGINSAQSNTRQYSTVIGSSGNRVVIPGLRQKKAEYLKIVILEQIKRYLNRSQAHGV